MPKDSQMDPKEIRKEKSHGGSTITDEDDKNHNCTQKKQSASRHKPGSDK